MCFFLCCITLRMRPSAVTEAAEWCSGRYLGHNPEASGQQPSSVKALPLPAVLASLFFSSLSLSLYKFPEHLSSLAAQSHSFQVPTQSNRSRHRPSGRIRSQSAGREQLCKLMEALGCSWAVPFLTSVVLIISSSLHWRGWTVCLKQKRRPSTGHPSGQRK